jgi:hypothetical protein
VQVAMTPTTFIMAPVILDWGGGVVLQFYLFCYKNAETFLPYF